ncbi:MAG TPA: DUF4153 domain-containing protein [Bacteroidia bacterium]|jgi:hypothetical protein|nr:DUF4153 domain-containing protein [Bacteroidia bacterium]
MKKNDWILLTTAGLYSYLFYGQVAGVNFVIFTFALCSALLLQNKELLKNKLWLIAAAGSLLSALCTGYYGNTLSVIANVISLSLLSGMSIPKNSSLLFTLLFSFYSYAGSLLFILIERIDKREERTENPKIGFKKITLLLIPFLITLLFFFMYRSSNILFNDLAKKINLDFISMNWITFTLGGFILLYGFFHHRKITMLSRFDEKSVNCLDPGNTNTISLFGKKLSISEEDFSGKALFIMLNLLLLVVNGLDLNFLFVDGKLPKELTFSEFVHQGTGMLITSIIVAIAVILFYFRGALNFYKSNTTLKWLAYLWIFQNILILSSTVMRNEIYIHSYGLTHKRIGVYVYLLLSAIGLITTWIKIGGKRSNMYLFRVNSWLFYGILVISCFFNWDNIITVFNINKAGQLDKNYLISLSNTNLPLLYKLKQDSTHKHKEFTMGQDELSYADVNTRNGNTGFDFEKYLNIKLFFYVHHGEELGWKSWYYNASAINTELQKLNACNTVYKLDLGATGLTTLAGIKNFKALKKLNLDNNSLNSLSGIEALTNLEELELSENSITDFSPIYALRKLKILNITHATPEQVKALQNHLPNTKINYTNA